jgi:hypothetical protein
LVLDIFKPTIWLVFLLLVNVGRLPAQELSYPAQAVTIKELPPAALHSTDTDDHAWYQMIATCIARADVSTDERAKLIAEALIMVNRRSNPLVQSQASAPPFEILDPKPVTSNWLTNPFATRAESPAVTTLAPALDFQKQLDELRHLRQTVQTLEQQLQAQKSEPFQLPSFQREIEDDVRPVLASAQGPVIDRLSDSSEVVAALPAENGFQQRPAPIPLTPAQPSVSGPLLPLPPKAHR